MWRSDAAVEIPRGRRRPPAQGPPGARAAPPPAAGAGGARAPGRRRGLTVVAGCGRRLWRGHDEAAVAGVAAKDLVTPDEMVSRAWRRKAASRARTSNGSNRLRTVRVPSSTGMRRWIFESSAEPRRWQGLLAQSVCIPTAHGGRMSARNELIELHQHLGSLVRERSRCKLHVDERLEPGHRVLGRCSYTALPPASRQSSARLGHFAELEVRHGRRRASSMRRITASRSARTPGGALTAPRRALRRGRIVIRRRPHSWTAPASGAGGERGPAAHHERFGVLQSRPPNG